MSTVRDEQVGQAPEAQADDEAPPAHLDAGARTGAGARGPSLADRSRAVAAAVAGWVRAWWSHERPATPAERAAPRVRRDSLWSQSPASPAQVWAFTRAGAWVKGKRHPALEAAGKVYGAVAVAAVTVLYAAAWTVMRPSHLLGVAGFVVLLVLSWGS